ncbi:putative transposase/invertase (TIGR01784 family) [Klebsiella oxytoca]|uniref:Putative transposase/invertase (TIGR01784 family) n=1 Tax=Klebsiella oxytoca TaxID=571 RepID=A0A318FQ37_KLEOX|nr:putative transposase/invertase (TIGR01784 family) [Klebsiella oxytoca]
MPDNQIVLHQRMAMLELLQKHIRQRDLAKLQPMFITLLALGYLTETQINSLISDTRQAGTTEKPRPLIRELAKQSPRHKELLMTIAEWLEEKDRKKGRKEGLLEDSQEISRSITLKMLASGAGRQDDNGNDRNESGRTLHSRPLKLRGAACLPPQ